MTKIDPKLRKALTGISGILVTPFDADNNVAPKRLKPIIDRAVGAGVHILVANGNTGEFYGLTTKEAEIMVHSVAEQLSGRAPLLGGVGRSIGDACAGASFYCGRPLAARPPELQKVFTAYRKKLYSAVISGRVTTTVGSCAIGIAQHGDAGPTSSLWVCVLMVLSIRAIFSSSTTSIERFSAIFRSFVSLNSSKARISSACVTTASDGMPALVSSPVSSSS